MITASPAVAPAMMPTVGEGPDPQIAAGCPDAACPVTLDSIRGSIAAGAWLSHAVLQTNPLTSILDQTPAGPGAPCMYSVCPEQKLEASEAKNNTP